jgi:putative DNA primase/helicase
LLLSGYPIVSLDNCNGELGGDFLCQAVERPMVRVRALGRSDIFEIESRSSIYATGNALRVCGDMVRRTLVCTLDAGVERPELRKFEGAPVAEILADRGRYVAACLTIVMAYQQAGFPNLLPHLASFEDWSGLVRSALVWLGEADPCKSQEAAREDDPELSTIREVIGLWKESVGVGLDHAQTVRHVAEMASSRAQSQMGEPADFAHPDLRDALLRIAGVGGAINTRKMGNWLVDHAGRIVGGFKFMRHPTVDRTGVARWAVAKV